MAILEEASPDSPSLSATPPRRELRTYWPLWIAFLLLAVASLVYLVAAPSPWSEGLDTSREVKESVRTRSWVVIGLWTGAAINLVLMVGALLLWNFRPRMVDLSDPTPPPSPEGGSWIIRILVLLAIATSALMMAPRLSLGIWGDEDATTRRFLIGHVYRMEDDSFIIKRPSWSKTIWNYDSGTNHHQLYNIFGRLSHGPADVSGEDPSSFYFDTARIRLPSYLATLAMIASAAWLVCLLGFPRGAPLTAFLLAFHPWIVRFGSDARGYALQILFGMLAVAFLVRAFQSPRQARWWIGFGICQFLTLSSNLSAVYLLVPLNLAGLWMAWAPHRPGQKNPFQVANVWRLVGGTLLGALLTIQWMMPLAFQMPAYLKSGRLEGELGDGFFADWVSFWGLGCPWHEWNPENPFSLTWQEHFGEAPVATAAAAILLAIFFLAGVIALLARPRSRWWILPLLGPPFLLIGDALRSGHLLYPWYTVAFLAFGLVVVGVGFDRAFSGLRKKPPALAFGLPLVVGLATLASFAAASAPQRKLYQNHPVEPTGEAVRLAREIVNPFHPDIDQRLTLGFVHASRLYDPAMIFAETDEEFVAGLREADERGLPLSVNAANLGLGPIYFPLASELIRDRDVFEEPEVIHGLQEPCTRYVFRYRPGGLQRFEEREKKSPSGEN